ncbi:hypothetical protein DENSPDRAFT_835353 [Dentipellis sp. KUC8613]|nr:hypothetical protein DENSPDRAFT_835353 [Dentipellis sp. KUC8613]
MEAAPKRKWTSLWMDHSERLLSWSRCLSSSFVVVFLKTNMKLRSGFQSARPEKVRRKAFLMTTRISVALSECSTRAHCVCSTQWCHPTSQTYVLSVSCASLGHAQRPKSNALSYRTRARRACTSWPEATEDPRSRACTSSTEDQRSQHRGTRLVIASHIQPPYGPDGLLGKAFLPELPTSCQLKDMRQVAGSLLS